MTSKKVSNILLAIELDNRKAKKELKSFVEEIKGTTKEITNLSTAIKLVSKSKEPYINLVKKTDKATNDLKQTNNNYIQSVDAVYKAQTKTQVSFELATNLVNTYKDSLKVLAQEMKLSAETFLEFESTMRGVNSIALESQENYDVLTQKVRLVAKDKSVVQGANDVGKAMIPIVQANFNLAESLDLVKLSSQGATAAMTDVETISSGLAKMMSTFEDRGRSIETAKEYLDDFFRTQKKGMITVKELIQNMPKINTLLRKLGENAEIGQSMFITMSKLGYTAPQISTRITQFVQKSTEANEKTREFAKEVLGLDMSFKHIKEVGLTAYINEMAKALKGNEEFISKLFKEQRAKEGALAILNNEAKEFNIQLDGLRNNAGDTSDALDEVLKANKATLQQINAIIEDLRIGFGEVVIEIFAPFIEIIRDALDFLSNLSKEQKRWIVITGLAVVAIGGFTASIITLNLAIKSFIAFNMTAQLTGLTSGAISLSGAFGLLGKSLGVLVGVGGFFYALHSALDIATEKMWISSDSILHNIDVLGNLMKIWDTWEIKQNRKKDEQRNIDIIGNAHKKAKNLRNKPDLNNKELKELAKAYALLSTEQGISNKQKQYRLKLSKEFLSQIKEEKKQIIEYIKDTELLKRINEGKLDKEGITQLLKDKKIDIDQYDNALDALEKYLDEQQRIKEKEIEEYQRFKEQLIKNEIKLNNDNFTAEIKLLRMEYDEKKKQAKNKRDIDILESQFNKEKVKIEEKRLQETAEKELTIHEKVYQKKIKTNELSLKTEKISKDTSFKIYQDLTNEKINFLNELLKKYSSNKKLIEQIEDEIFNTSNEFTEKEYEFKKAKNDELVKQEIEIFKLKAAKKAEHIELLANLELDSAETTLKKRKEIIDDKISIEQKLLENLKNSDKNTKVEQEQVLNNITSLNNEKLLLDANYNKHLKAERLKNLEHEQNTYNQRLQNDREYLNTKLELYNNIANSIKKISSNFGGSFGSTIGGLGENFQSGANLFGNLDRSNTEMKSLQHDINTTNEQFKIDIAGKSQVEIMQLFKVADQKVKTFQSKIDSISSDSFNNVISTIASEVSKNISTIISNYENLTRTYSRASQVSKVFANDSKQVYESQLELNEILTDQLRNIPGVGDAIASLGRAWTDLLGLTTSEDEKKKNAEILQSSYTLQKTKLELGKQTTAQFIELADLELNNSLENLVKKGLAEEAFYKEKETLELKHQKKILDIRKEYFNKSLETSTEYVKSLYSNNIVDIEAEKTLLALEFFNESAKALEIEDETQRKLKLQSINNNYNAKLNSIELKYSNERLNIDFDLQNSRLDLLEDSINKRKTLIENEFKHEKSLLDNNLRYKRITKEEYNKKLLILENKLKKGLFDIQKESNDKIQGINENSYNAELKIIQELYSKKTKELQDQVNREIEIIKSRDERLKEIDNKRELDQESKQKRKEAFNNSLANFNPEASFFRSNPDDFDTGNGQNKGNETLRKKAIKDFQFGDMGVNEYYQTRSQLGLEKYVYYLKQAELYDDPDKKDALLEKARQGKEEYYEFVFDKEKELVEIETKEAKKRLEEKQSQLDEATRLEKAEIEKLDSAYKDSSGNYKNYFVNATRDWTAYARNEVNNLSKDTLNIINESIDKLKESKKEVQNITNSNNNQFSSDVVEKSQASTFKPGSIPIPLPGGQMIYVDPSEFENNRSKPDSQKESGNNLFTGLKVIADPSPVQNNTALTKEQRRKGANEVYSQYGATHYERVLRLNDDEFIKEMDKKGINFRGDGGITEGWTIAGEKGHELIFDKLGTKKIGSDYDIFSNIYDKVLNSNFDNSISNIVNNSNSQLAPIINIYAADASEAESGVMSAFKNLHRSAKNIR